MKHINQLLILLLASTVTAKADFLYHYQFNEEDTSIIDSGAAKCNGVYSPAADKDNDTPETSDPKRYRKDIQGRRSLGFFPDLGSYGTIPKFVLPDKVDELHILLVCKVGGRSIQYLCGNKMDSGVSGFSLMRWGANWHFNFGNGKESFCAKAPVRTLNEFITLEIDLASDGTVSIYENGKMAGTAQFKNAFIAGGVTSFHIGNYPGKNKNVYPAECFMDELIISGKRITERVQIAKPEVPAIRCVLSPVEGNAMHFGNQKVLHSFAGHPVPATWFLTYEKTDAVPVLEWTLPEGVTILEAFRSKRNAPRKCYRLQTEGGKVTMGPGELETSLKDEQATVAFDSKKDAVIHWRLLNGDKVILEDSFTLKILPDLPKLPNGRFHSHSWLISDLSFYSRDVLDRVAETYVRSGLTGKGRYYIKYPQQVAVDEYLKEKFGFTLWDVSLWGGPLGGYDPNAELPQAKDADGKPLKYLCPTAFIQESDSPVRKRYEKTVKETLISSSAAVMDFEPWGRPSKGCFCERCINEFNKRFQLACKNGYEIRNEHRGEWSQFWVEITASYMKVMGDTAQKAVPGIPLWDYTYVFPYNDQQALEKRWWSIPKDPRLNEKMLEGSFISMYHINGREAFEQLDLSLRHLKKKVNPISLISQTKGATANYTSVEDALSPRQIYLKVILTGALGMDIFGIYPGGWIDGAYHVALNQATAQIRAHEDFYLDGKRRRDIQVVPADPNTLAAAWVASVFDNKKGKKLVTVINFSDKPLDFKVAGVPEVISVRPISAAWHIW